MATIVGFLDLNKQLENLSTRIENQLRNHWLDGDTAHAFKKEFHFKRSRNDVKLLEALLTKINSEITWRKDNYGHERRSAEA